MQGVATTIDSRRRRFAGVATSVVTCVLGASLFVTPGAFAQEATPSSTPNATAVAETAQAEITVLFEQEVEAFPSVPVSVRLLRMTLAPGASSPRHSHPGYEFDLVESGTLTIDAGDDARIERGGDAAVGPFTGEQVSVGELVTFPPHTDMYLQNTSDEDLVLLSAVFHPVNVDLPSTVYTDGNPPTAAFEGVSYVVLGDGAIEQFPEGAATVRLDSITADAGVNLPGFPGVTLYSLVDGDFSFAVDSGDVQVSRSASPGLRPNAAIGQEFTLESHDAVFFPGGVNEIDRANQERPVTMLRLIAVPAAGAIDRPAAIAMRVVRTEQPALAPGEFGIDAIAVVNIDSVNMRAEPTTSADIVDQLSEGTEVRIIDGPTDADDYTWWQIALESDESVIGWIAQDFLTLPDAPEPTPTPAPERTVTDAKFQPGDTVVATEDNVRIRDEPSLEGEPLNAFPAGTRFIITGDPVEADDYVWYPVTLENGAEPGWTVEDFLELDQS